MKFFKTVVLPCFLLALVSVYAWLQIEAGNSNERNLKFIQDHINNQGMLVDFKNEIRVKTAEDIKLFYTEKKVEIEFGNIVLEWDKDNFRTKETIDGLKSIGIIFRLVPATDDFRLFYQGTEIKRWLR